MSKAKKTKGEQKEEMAELTFSNSQEKLNSLKDNEAFFRELSTLLIKFHKTIDKHGKKHNLQLDSSVIFKLEE